MTIPEGTSGDPAASRKAGKAGAHLSRPKPQRRGPKRAGAGAGRADPPGAAAPPPGSAEDRAVGDSVAHAVKVGYDVIAENIRQGREAAARFRQGEYNVREVPGDLQIMALRLIRLARELSTTTFDVCERLLKEAGANVPPEDRAAEVPPFRAAAAAAPKPGAQAAEAGVMNVTTRFVGAGKALGRTTSLVRPRRPTAAGDISVTPLAGRAAGAKPIGGVSFETDVSVEGIIAVVKIRKGQAPGVYSGLVHAPGDDVPLGVLTIEIPK